MLVMGEHNSQREGENLSKSLREVSCELLPLMVGPLMEGRIFLSSP